MSNFRFCHKCEFSDLRCAGACLCRVDNVDITIHASRNSCPHPRGPRFGSATWSDPAPPPSTPAPRLKPVPLESWPAWASSLADAREPEDIGVGDTIHRKLAEGGFMFKATLKAMGVPCGCDKRRDEFNVLYPY